MKTASILKQLMQAHRENAYQLAERSGVPQPTIHRILSGQHAEPRSSTLRKLAQCYGLTESHLRGDLVYSISHAEGSGVAVQASSVVYGEFARIAVLEQLKTDVNQPAASLELRQSWLEQQIGVPAPQLRVFSCFDADMSPTLNPDDLLLLDVSTQAKRPEGIYLVSAHGTLKLRRFRLTLSGQQEMSCDNPAIRTVDNPLKIRGLTVVGRVCHAWTGKRIS